MTADEFETRAAERRMAGNEQPSDVTARVVEAMTKLEGTTLPYIPPWLRIDRGELTGEPEPNSHVMVSLGNGRFLESDGSGSVRRVR